MSVTQIGNFALTGCKKLTSITVPNRLTVIGDGVFSNCTELTSAKRNKKNHLYYTPH